MGNRYGRNQKRKHRELTARLLREMIQAKADNIELKNQVSYFIQMDREIAQTLGSATALRLLTDRISSSNTEVEQMHLNLFNRSPYVYTGMTGELIAQASTTRHTIRKLFNYIQQDPSKHGAYIKVLVGNETEAAIFIDDDYLARGGLTPRDIEYLAKDLTIKLADFINNRYEQERNVNHANRQDPTTNPLLLRRV